MYWEDPLVAFLPQHDAHLFAECNSSWEIDVQSRTIKRSKLLFHLANKGRKKNITESPLPKYQSVVTGISGMSSNITPVCLMQKYRYNKFNRIFMHAIMNDKVTNNINI